MSGATTKPAPNNQKTETVKENPELRIPKRGDWVWWYLEGDFGATPIPAMVTNDPDMQRACSLTIFEDGRFDFVKAAKHMHHKATPTDRNRNGGWSWARGVQPAEKQDAKKD